MRKLVVLLAILSLAVLLYGISKTAVINKTFNVSDTSKLILDNVNGTIRITGWDKDYADVTITKKTRKRQEELDKVRIDITFDNDLKIETKYLTINPKVDVSYELSVPRYLLLKNIHTSNGRIDIEDAGKVENVKTSNGAITLRKCSGSILAETSNGSIDAGEIDGSVYAHTSNGKIKLQNIHGVGDARTSNGSIQIYNVTTVENTKTSNGSIKVQLKDLPADTNISTQNGTITLYLAKNLNANISASTSNGRIQLHDYPVLASEISKSYVNGSVGKGGKLLTVSTSNAGIHIYDDEKIEY